MGGLLCKHDKSNELTRRQAVRQLKKQRNELKQYEKKIEMERNRELGIKLARQLLCEDKKEIAKLVLRKRMYQNELLLVIAIRLEGLQEYIRSMEFAPIALEVIERLEAGNGDLKKLHDIVNIDDICKITEDTQEGVEKRREVERLCGRVSEYQETVLEAELDEIMHDIDRMQNQGKELEEAVIKTIEQKQKMKEQNQKMKEQNQKMKEQNQKMKEQNQKMKELNQKMKEQKQLLNECSVNKCSE